MRSRFRRLPTRTRKARTKRPSIRRSAETLGRRGAAPHLRSPQGVTFLTCPVKTHFRARIQIFFAVPEFYTIDGAAFAGELDLASFSAGANALSDGKLFLPAVGEMNDNALKLNRTTTNAQLNLVKRARCAAHMNRFVVLTFIDVGCAEQNPMLGVGYRRD